MENFKEKLLIFEGETIEKAIEKAVQELQLDRSFMEIKVVCEEKRGLFGMQGSKPAKIVVKIRNAEKDI